GRRESIGVVTHRDLFCLWSLTEGRPSNLAYLFLTHMEQMSRKNRGAICGGTYITRLAWRLDIFWPDPQTPATCLHLPIDMTIMTRMGLVQRVAGGGYALTQPLVPPAAPQGEDPHAEDPVPQAGTEELEPEGSAAGPADIGAAPMDSDLQTPAGPSTVPTLQSLQAEITDMVQILDMMRQEQISQGTAIDRFRQEQAEQRAMIQRAEEAWTAYFKHMGFQYPPPQP